MIIPLGLVLLAVEIIDEHISDFSSNIFFFSSLFILVIVLGFLEAGYIFRVIEETTQGTSRLPKFNNLLNLFVHGLKETIIYGFYLLMPLLLILLSVFFLSVNVSTSDMEENLGIVLIIAGIILTFGSTFIMMPILLNMAHNQGNLRSAFNFRQIRKKISSIGIKNLLIPYLFTWLILGSFYIYFSPHVKAIPLIGIYISQLVITPYLIIFTGRLLGLIDKNE